MYYELMCVTVASIWGNYCKREKLWFEVISFWILSLYKRTDRDKYHQLVIFQGLIPHIHRRASTHRNVLIFSWFLRLYLTLLNLFPDEQKYCILKIEVSKELGWRVETVHRCVSKISLCSRTFHWISWTLKIFDWFTLTDSRWVPSLRYYRNLLSIFIRSHWRVDNFPVHESKFRGNNVFSYCKIIHYIFSLFLQIIKSYDFFMMIIELL